MLRNDDLRLLAYVWERLTFFDVRACRTSQGGQRDRSFAAGRHHGAWCAHQRGDLLSDCCHQLVQLDEVEGRLIHGAFHFRQRAGACNDRVGTARVQNGAHTNLGE